MPDLIDTHAHLDSDQFADDVPAVLERAAPPASCRSSRRHDRTSSAACVQMAADHPRRLRHGGRSSERDHPGRRPRCATRWCACSTAPAWSAWARRGWIATGTRLPSRSRRNGSPGIWNWDAPAACPSSSTAATPRPTCCGCCAGVRPPRADPRRHALLRRVTGDGRGVPGDGPAPVVRRHVDVQERRQRRDVAAKVPLDRGMVETDCPYLSPVPLRGKRNEPANVVHTATCLAEVRGVSLETLAGQTTRNARLLFGLPGGDGS